MKNCIYLLLLAIAIGVSSCYPSDPGVSPFVGEWSARIGMVNDREKITITNEYFFIGKDLIPDYRYTMDDQAFHITQLWLPKDAEFYEMRCTYLYRNDTLFIHDFYHESIISEYVHVALTRIEK